MAVLIYPDIHKYIHMGYTDANTVAVDDRALCFERSHSRRSSPAVRPIDIEEFSVGIYLYVGIGVYWLAVPESVSCTREG